MIMQNKPNSRKAKMNLTFYLTKDYGNKPCLRTPKNKPNQTQFQKVHLLSPGTKQGLKLQGAIILLYLA
jgi:hypothetical protein